MGGVRSSCCSSRREGSTTCIQNFKDRTVLRVRRRLEVAQDSRWRSKQCASVGRAPPGPVFHQLSPPFEHITAPIGRFHGVADRMAERHFGQLICV